MPDTRPDHPPQHIGVREFRGNMSQFLQQARQGATLLITSHGEVIAELGPPAAQHRAPRQPGALRGKIWMAPDFDSLPADILAVMEGEEG